jgi:hypothetical protein
MFGPIAAQHCRIICMPSKAADRHLKIGSTRELMTNCWPVFLVREMRLAMTTLLGENKRLGDAIFLL